MTIPNKATRTSTPDNKDDNVNNYCNVAERNNGYNGNDY